jgi:hypothetical protein
MRIPAACLAFLLWGAGSALAQVTPADTTAPAPADTAAIEAPAPPDTTTVEAVPPDTTAAPADTAAVEAPPPAAADEAAVGPDEEPATPTHDWEFSLTPTGRVTDVNGRVMVTEGDAENTYVVEIGGLPDVNTLDEEGRDLAAYTVWIVPAKDRVQESTLAGTIVAAADGPSRFEGTTTLDTFGVIVMASVEGATGLSGVPILTGIPITQAEVPAAAPAQDVAPAGEPVSEPAPEVQPPPTPPDGR